MSTPSSSIESTLVENRVFEPSEAIRKAARISGMDAYNALCAEAEKDFEGFWAQRARETLTWSKPFTKVLDESNKPFYKWFEDGELNASFNCLDRHMGTPVENKTAIIFEADGGEVTKVTYKELLAKVSQFANALKARGVKKGDRVVIYMPMTIEGVVAMQACARIGATHSVVFGGFSAKALQERIQDAGAVAVITANYQLRGGKELPLKSIVDEGIAMGGCDTIKDVIVFQRTPTACNMVAGRDSFMHDVMAGQSTDCPAEMVGAEHPLFVLYTSGSTGKPKGVQHSTGGYLLWANLTMNWTFDLKDNDVFWCTADIGWITGHSYVAYGPLAAGATQIVFEGVPTYPNAGRFWQMIEKHKCTIFYTAPTAIRSLIKAAEGDEKVHPKNWDLTSLRLMGSVGEPINPEAWLWYHRVAGKERLPIVDTWWQTETGGILISPLPGAIPTKPGSATKPFFGIEPALVDPDGKFIEGPASGNLVLKGSWPGQARTLYGDHQRFTETYFSTYKGLYFTGDGSRLDEDGYWWITGRVDDVLNVSGHRLGTAEVESALVGHPKGAEAAVVGYPHDIKGQGIYCYVTPIAGVEGDAALDAELKAEVRREIGPIATPDQIHFTPALPKTRSGKIMRRILRKIAENDFGSLGDTTTLADPSVVDSLIAGRKNR